MKKLIEYFVRYPVLGNSILALIAVFGIFSFITTKTTFFPDQPSKFINITSSYLGASPEEIEEGITTKIEDAIKGITGVDRTTSVSLENSASISVELQSGADANIVIQDIQSAVNSISSFPAGMERLNVYKQEPRDFVISFAVHGDLSLRELKTYARRIERELLAKDGISKLTISGFPEEEIEVSFNENDLRAYGITFDEAARAISAANVKITGGKIKGDLEELLIRADNKKYYADELKNQVLKTTSDGTVIRLKDIASVSEKWSENPNRSYFNGKQSIIVELQKTNDEDLFIITDIVKEYLEEFNSKHADVQLGITRDGSQTIRDRRTILENNGMIGIFLVVLFLGLSLSPKISFWVSISIPLSFLGMFALAPMYGLTLNVMSLLAMILVIGILVDDGIIVAENIYSHLEKGEPPIKAAVDGTIEVLPSVITGVTTTILIFLIFFFLEGALGDRAKDLTFVVAGTLGFSLLEAMIILPAHIAHIKNRKKNGSRKNIILLKAEQFINFNRDRIYKPALNYSIKHPFIILAIPIALFIITIGALKGNILKTTFFPNIENNNVQITLELPSGTNDLITDSILTYIEKKVWEADQEYSKEFPEEVQLVQTVVRSVGPNTHTGRISVSLVGSEERVWDNTKFRALVRDKVGTIKNADKLQIGGGNFFGMPVSIALQSADLKQLREAKNELKDELQKISTLKDIVDNDPPGLKEVKIKLNENAYNLGITTAAVMNQVRAGFFGQEAQRLLRGIDEVKIWVRYSQEERKEIDQLKNMRIRLAGGKEIPLSEIADISIERGILSINHIDGQRIIKVEADLVSKQESVTNILANIKNNIQPEFKKKYPDVSWQFEGESRESGKTFKSMIRIVPSFLVLMFMLVVFTFRSFLQAAVVYVLIPFSIIGVMWGHFIQGYIFSILSGFGAIALMGIVINDSLVFITAFNRYLAEGQKFEEALRNAGLNRFRPVILTSITTIAGLAPLIFEPSIQAQFLSPMAISVAYGLLLGTLLTLVMIPSLLVLANKLKVFISRIRGNADVTQEDVEPSIIEQRRLQNLVLRLENKSNL
ncbi:MAG: efflux RND transporter permease subunit [Bacteroidetes bacterium]|nr:efflux RND transporter permease subunit [Bacteroidota bacterium]MBU1678024.1 efflux RND transporter permease subunit [Bacteroidota bacterium]